MKFHAAILFMSFAGLAACGGEPQQPTAKAAEAVAEVEIYVVSAPDSAAAPLTVSSTLTVEHEADLLAYEEGQLEQVLADLGQRVKRGEVLAKLDATRLRSQLDQDKAEVQLQQASAEQAEVLRQGAEVELQRQTELRKEGLGSLRDFDRARFSLQAYRQEVEKAKATSEQAKAKLQDDEIRFSRMSLRAPFDGIVSRRYARVGQMILRDERVLRVTELRPLLVRFAVPESARLAAAPGAEVRVFPADPAAGVARARVVRSSQVVDASSGALECTAQLLEPLPGGLVPGMAVDVRIPTASSQAAPMLVVPAGALRRAGEGAAELFVVQGDRLQKRSVKIGRETTSGVQVLSGIAPGDRVVARVSDSLRDAMPARIRP